MAVIFDCLHNLGTLFPMKHLLSISSSHLCEVDHILFSCSTSTSSMPAACLFLSAAIPFLYSSSEKGYTNVTSPVASVCTTWRLDWHGMVLWPLMSSWCATSLELTRHGGVEMVKSLERFLIVCNALRLSCVRSVDVTTYSHLFFFSSVILSTILVPVSMIVLLN